MATVRVDDPSDDGERADVVLGRRVPGLSRRVARTLAQQGRLRIDGRAATASTRVHAGQTLELRLDATPPLPELVVLARSDRFVYVDKPAGLPTVALVPGQAALSTLVARSFPECGRADPTGREAGAVHRLDRDTTGVVAFARTPEAWRSGRDAFSRGRVDKHYLAIAIATADTSWPPPGTRASDRALPTGYREPSAAVAIVGRLAAAPPGDRMTERPDGRLAHTDVWCLDRRGDACLLLLALHTGVRHQARAQLAHVGWPVAGDPIYGPPSPSEGLMLHAARLWLGDALADEPVIEATWPAAMADFARRLGLHAPHS